MSTVFRWSRHGLAEDDENSMKFKNAAHTTAAPARARASRTPVAMELAASWNRDVVEHHRHTMIMPTQVMVAVIGQV